MKRLLGLVLVSVAAVSVLAGCGQSDKDAATETAKKYVVATWKQQCQMNSPEMGGAAQNCDSDSDEVVWANHPTDVESVTEWQDGGYAVVIPDAQGVKDVMGLKKVGSEWKVVAYSTIDDEDAVQKDPACRALSEEDGQDCQ